MYVFKYLRLSKSKMDASVLPAEIVVVGSCNIDLIAYVPAAPLAGETVFGSSFQQGFGGKGANQAVMAAKLSDTPTNTAMIAAVGDDSFGRQYEAELTRVGVRPLLKTVCGVSTGVAPICVDNSGENRIIVIPGANDMLSESDVESHADVIRGAKVLLCQLEIPTLVTLAALQLAAKHGVTTVFTPAPVPLSPSLLPRELFSCVDVLVCNRGEGRALAGMMLPAEDKADGATTADKTTDTTHHIVEDTTDGTRKMINKLQEMGCKAVIVTLGAGGCIVATGDGSHPMHIPAVKILNTTTVDTTGAGDAFTGALAYFCSVAKAAGQSACELSTLVDCARRATYIAAITVTKKGTQTSYPTRCEVPAPILIFGSDSDSDLLPLPVPL